ncbi:hypothetical protein ACHQM5_013246 [Ranunculus cassubicifolius]
MEGTSILTSSSTKPHLKFNFFNSHSQSHHTQIFGLQLNSNSWDRKSILLVAARTSLLSPVLSVSETLEKSADNTSSLPKIDKSGRFCSPRAARELAVSIAYAACLEGSDPVRMFEKRINAKREPGYEFNKSKLMEYNHMNFAGDAVSTQTEEEAEEMLMIVEKESMIDAEVLSAPPKLVYSKLILRLTKKMLVAVAEGWDKHVLVIDKVAPQNWKDEPAGRILEFCILHLAMAEIGILGTRHQIVINEAVDLAKRFCDGSSPRIINGCLRTYIKIQRESNVVSESEARQ